MAFTHEVFISFHLVDRAGILFFGHVFPLAHQVFEAFISQKLNLSWEDWFQNNHWIVPIKQTEAFYQAPLIAGQICSIKLCIEEIKNSSFVSSYSFYQNHTECCVVKMVHTFCSTATRKKIEIPNPIREKLILTKEL